MSHTYTTEDPEFDNLEILKAGFKLMGWKVIENNVARTWDHNPDKLKVYPFVAVNPEKDGYDVGIIQKDGKCQLKADNYAPGKVIALLGKNYEKLKQRCALAYAQQQAKKKGWKVKFTEKDNNLIVEVSS